MTEKTVLNIEIGKRLQQARKQAGYTQIRLAEKLGLTFQALQKYEKGQTQVSCERAVEISIILGMPSHFLIDNIVDNANKTPIISYSHDTKIANFMHDYHQLTSSGRRVLHSVMTNLIKLTKEIKPYKAHR